MVGTEQQNYVYFALPDLGRWTHVSCIRDLGLALLLVPVLYRH